MTATRSTTDDQGPDGRASNDPSALGGWVTQWTDLLFWPWRELPAVVRSLASQLISMAERPALPTDPVAARLDAFHDAIAVLERRVAALEAQTLEDDPRDDATEVPRLPMRSADAFREVLSRAGEVAAQRGLTRSSGSATVVSDRGPEMHAEAGAPARPSRKAPRGRGRRT
jgi:hypothetical protein